MHEVNAICFVTNLCVAALIGGLTSIVPVITRKSFLFGVKIPIEKQNCPEAKAMKKRYVTICLAGTLILLALVIVQYLAFPHLTPLATLYVPLLFVALQAAAYIPNWRRTRALKREQGWLVSESMFAETGSSHSRGNLSDVPWAWYVVSLLVVATGIIITLIKYPTLPAQIPTHFDLTGHPNAWANPSLSSALSLPLINLALLLVLWLTGVMLVQAKLQIDPQRPALSFVQHRLYRRRMGNCMGFLSLSFALMLLLLSFMTLWPGCSFLFWLVFVLPLVSIVVFLVVSVSSGQAGCRIHPKTLPPEKAGISSDVPIPGAPPDRTDDRYWALGMFYHNPDDPAYIVEDRFGSNLGFNYSRFPVKVGITIGLLAFVALYAWATVLMGAIQ